MINPRTLITIAVFFIFNLVGNKFKRVTEEYTYQVRCYIRNDMSKYKLKNYKK